MRKRKLHKKNQPATARKDFVFEELEPRLLLSADLPIDVPDAYVAEDFRDQEILQAFDAQQTESQQQDAVSLELIFVDTDTPEYQTLLSDLLKYPDDTTRYQVFELDNTRDGIAQITEILSGYENVSAVHILSHGTEAAIDLGGSTLDSDALAANAERVGSWGSAFTDDGDILIYGCDLAATSEGQMLVNSIATLTGADVAASDDLTGNAQLGGDWELEYRTGSIESTVAISSQTQNSWSGVLAFNVDTTADTPDANPGDTLAEDGSGNTSLRAAIEESNALTGADTINIGAGTFTLGLGEITITSDITITGAGVDQTFIDGATLDRIFFITSGTVTISDLTIMGGSATGGGSSGQGGGMYIASAADVTLNNVVLTANNASGTGGALHNLGTLTLNNVTANLNNADRGAAINNIGVLVIADSTLSNNTADSAGGAIRNSGTGGLLTMTNVTISGNTVTSGTGGGIDNYANGAIATLTNVTVTNNSASTGSGIRSFSGNTTLSNTIVAGNLGSPDLAGDFTSNVAGGNNFIGDVGTASGFTDSVNGDQVGTTVSPIDPLLGALADNGGPTLSHALLTGSTAIDGGTNTGAPATDQRGTARDDGTIDIGAFEYRSAEVSIYQPWTNLAVSTDRSTTISENYTVTAAPDSDRLLVVTMVTRFGFDQTIDVTSASFGGVQLHEIVEGSSVSTRNGVWMGYLLDSEILAGNQTLTVSFTSTVSDPTGTKLLAATYVGVDQTTPINDSSANNTKADAPITFGSQIDYAAGAEVVYVASYGGNTNTNTTEPAGYSKIYTNEWSGLLMTTIGHMDDTTTAGNSPASTSVDFEGTDANHSLAVVALNPVLNAAPVVTTTGTTLAYTENTAATAIDATLTLSDSDSTNLSGATVTISANYANGEDVLAFTNQLGITSSWDADAGVLTLTGTTTIANYQTALRSITYVNTSENPSTATRTVSFVANDGMSDSNVATVSITVDPVNDAPTFIGNSIGYWNFDEGSGDSVAESAIGISTGTLGSTAGTDANDPTWTTGKFGQALHFDGVNDYVEIVDAPGLDISGPEFSASLWMNPDSGPNQEDMFFMKGDRQGNINYYLSWKDSGKMTWAFKDSEGGIIGHGCNAADDRRMESRRHHFRSTHCLDSTSMAPSIIQVMLGPAAPAWIKTCGQR